jgi:hypothetical protein
MLSHSGKVKRDSLDDRAFMAFSISITTRLYSDISFARITELRLRAYMERETVEAALALSFENIPQPISGN